MKKIYILLLVVIACSCDEFLDVKPKGKAIPTTVEDYDLMLNAGSVSLGNAVYMDPDIYLHSEAFLMKSSRVKNAYIWADNQYSANQEDPDWNALYKKMYVDNMIIENIDNAESTTNDENLRSIVKAQAHADRAQLNFWLVNYYGKHYNSATASTDLAAPLKLENDLIAQLPRATVQKFYDLIEEDLEIAKEAPSNVETVFRASNAAVFGLMAKVALFKGEFSDALSYATTAINEHGSGKLINYADISDFYWNPVFNYWDNIEFMMYSKVDINPGITNEEVYITQNLVDLYTDKVNDLRYLNWYVGMDGTTSATVGQHRFVNTAYKTMSVQLNELYLIRAECYARAGNPDKAMDDVNFLRMHRFAMGSDYELEAVNAADALKIVKEERRRELVGHALNWFDLKRYQAYGETVLTYTRTVNGETYTLAPGNNRYLMAIPEYTRQLNPNLEQNPR